MMSEPDRFAREFGVSRETAERLGAYAGLLEKWNPTINLVSRGTLPQLWTRHFADSAQLLSLVEGEPTRWADLGSGGGFPGMVVAIMAQEKWPRLPVICIESDQRKATFLRSVARETGVGVEVIAARIEDVPPAGADVVSARALAPLDKLIGYTFRHLAPGGIGLFLKGTGRAAEVERALASWTFRLDTIPSRTDSGSAVLRVGDIRRV